MVDYGHPIRFGTFITPAIGTSARTVALAALSEDLGFDLVTFQDHPYHPGFLDTWTLLSWVAARTSRIHVSGNVLNLPLRPPGVLARAAASMQFLSEGRFELGLGAGYYWDAIQSIGGRRLSPGQGVDALSEAIEIIRGVWGARGAAPLQSDGDYYQLHGLRPGSSPQSRIPIWLGAAKPRMLRLIGTKADGWLPSQSQLPPNGLRSGNSIIDGAAAEAGRDPREIHRLLNLDAIPGRPRTRPLTGPMTRWADDLLPLALEHGISTFIFATDDPSALSEFAHTVIPALRTSIEQARHPRSG